MICFNKKALLFYFIFIFIFSFSEVSFSRNLQVSDLVCAKCGQPITGEYWTLDGKTYCPACYDSFIPRCAKCGALCRNGYYTIDKYIYCNECFNKYARCDICGAPLQGKFLRSKKGKKFCQNCVDKYLACDNCGYPVGPNPYNLGYHRWLCTECASVAIFTHDQLAYVYQEAVGQLKRLGLVVTRTVDNLTIMDQKSLEMCYHNTKSKEYVHQILLNLI